MSHAARRRLQSLSGTDGWPISARVRLNHPRRRCHFWSLFVEGSGSGPHGKRADGNLSSHPCALSVRAVLAPGRSRNRPNMANDELNSSIRGGVLIIGRASWTAPIRLVVSVTCRAPVRQHSPDAARRPSGSFRLASSRRPTFTPAHAIIRSRAAEPQRLVIILQHALASCFSDANSRQETHAGYMTESVRRPIASTRARPNLTVNCHRADHHHRQQ